jgi:DNA polymerase (family 10)
MPVHNKDIASIFNELADLLDIKGENQFRIRSYRNAARTISDLSENLADIAEDEKKLSALPGIGSSITKKIREIITTGRLKKLEDLKNKVPESLLEIMKLEQMGPHRTKILNKKLNINSINDLKSAAQKGEIEKIEGFGKKIQQNILKEIKEYRQKGGIRRFKWHEADDYVKPLVDYLDRKLENVTVAGSYRRRKETLGDIDVLATSENPDKAMDYFVSYEETERIIAKGTTKSSIKLRSGLQIDLRIVDKKSYGAALLYFTGSKEHNIVLRKIGIEKNYKVNEYGVFKGKKSVAGKTEEEIYKKLGLRFIEAELRENRGEIEAAKRNMLPHLVTMADIKGDLHIHTNATDGKYSLEDMAMAAKKRGYEYFAVTDHSKRVSMANGLDEKRLAQQIEKIDILNSKLTDIRILKSVEVDILEDGTLDLADDILKELDLVVGAVHYNRRLSREKQTERIIKAMDNPYFNILAHPTGRLIGEREAYDIDMEKIIRAAKERGCFLEINAYPDRLDLNDIYAKMAKETGLKLSVATDAHSVDNLNYMEYGIAQARRGWLEKDDVINTCSWKKLKNLLKR